jgi:hypothetical protein
MKSLNTFVDVSSGTQVTKQALWKAADDYLSTQLDEGRARRRVIASLGETQFQSKDLQLIASTAAMGHASMAVTPLLSAAVEEGRRSVVLEDGYEMPEVERQRVGDPITRSNTDRLTLLARKYVAKEAEQFSDEDRARLEIVTERMRRLIPAATVDEFEAVADVLQLAQRIADSNAEIRGLLEP